MHKPNPSKFKKTCLLKLRDVEEVFLGHEAGELRHDGHVLGDVEGVGLEGGEAGCFCWLGGWVGVSA